MGKIRNWVVNMMRRMADGLDVNPIKYNERSPSGLPMPLTPLTPSNDADIKGYYEALDLAFKNDEIKNIALSGAYGAGKSSVIGTYEKRKGETFLHISLAHFMPNREILNEDKSPDMSVPENDTAVLEWKILNQLIHQINPQSIPQTNFGVKKNSGKGRPFLASLAIIVFVSAVCHVFMFDDWRMLVNDISFPFLKSLLSCTTSAVFRLLSLFICAGIGWLGMYKFLVLQSDRKIVKGIDLKGTKIEMFDAGENSYFDKYLNEVLYLFDNSRYDVIVFEDMDRFDSNVIFERLREINTLVNASRKGGKPIIKFVYSLRDDIFANKDRTKFFDLIIPVVPYIDASNSFDMFIDVFKRCAIFNDFSQSFIQGLSLYVDEMRIIYNICNEYIIYKSRLGSDDNEKNTELDWDKLLAMIAYKNLFPRDFADLQSGRGFMFTLLDSKPEFFALETELIEAEINILLGKIEESKNEQLENETEVDIVYASKLSQANNKITQFRNPYNRSHNQAQLDEAEKELAALQSIMTSRKENVANRSENRQDAMKIQIDRLGKEMTAVRSKRIKDLLTRETIDQIFNSLKHIYPSGKEPNTFIEVRDNQYFALLKFLVGKGYIDETYRQYMTYFYPHSLSARDMAFCRSVTDRKIKEATYFLDNPKEIVSRLPAEYFVQPEVLNYALLDYLLESEPQSEHLKILIVKIIDLLEELKRDTNNNIVYYDFICGYLSKGREISRFVEYIGTKEASALDTIISIIDVADTVMESFALEIIVFLSKYTVGIDFPNLSAYISQNYHFLCLELSDDSPEANLITDTMARIGVSFKALPAENANDLLLSGVYKKSLYILSFGNIGIMIDHFYDLEDKNNEKLKTSNYSIIRSKPDSPLFKYVESYIEIYAKEILDNGYDLINDNLESIAAFLNNDDISVELKKRYIAKLGVKISDIVIIKNIELWEPLLKSDTIEYIASNVVNYFKAKDCFFDAVLSTWINSQRVALDFWNCAISNDEQDICRQFFDAIIKSENIDIKHFENFISIINEHYDDFSILDIKVDKMTILIKYHKIKMNSSNLIFLREKYPSSVRYFIARSFDIYLKIIEENPEHIHKNEIEYLISASSKISLDRQLALLKLTNMSLSVIGKLYSDKITLHIIRNNFLVADFSGLIASYDKQSKEIKEAIIELSITRTSSIISAKENISKELFDDLLNCDKIELKEKQYLLALAFSGLGEDMSQSYMTRLDMALLADVFDKDKKPQFDDTEINNYALEAFQRWGKIKEITKREDGKLSIKRTWSK